MGKNPFFSQKTGPQGNGSFYFCFHRNILTLGTGLSEGLKITESHIFCPVDSFFFLFDERAVEVLFFLGPDEVADAKAD